MSLASSGLEEGDKHLEGVLENLSRTHVHTVDRKGRERVPARSSLETRVTEAPEWNS